MTCRATLALSLSLISLGAPSPAAAQSTVLESGPARVELVELYTSEGCSSCPPADRWLSALAEAPGLWQQFVPIALHVDYWDDIGWPDRFASAAYSARQRRYAAEGGTRVVYTPGVFRNGSEWRDWRGGVTQRPAPDAGSLRVDIDRGAIRARYQPVDGLDADTLHVALLGMDLSTEVAAGENRGRRLQHDFVVLALRTLPLNDDGRGARTVNATLPAATIDAPQYAVAAWVTDGGRQAPVQAVGGFIDP